MLDNTRDYPRLPIDLTIERKATKQGPWSRYAIRPARSQEVIGHLETTKTATGRKFWEVSRISPMHDIEADLDFDMTPAQARKAVRGYAC